MWNISTFSMSLPAESSRGDFYKVREYREELVELANSDLPVSWIAEALLCPVDEDSTELSGNV